MFYVLKWILHFKTHFSLLAMSLRIYYYYGYYYYLSAIYRVVTRDNKFQTRQFLEFIATFKSDHWQFYFHHLSDLKSSNRSIVIMHYASS